VVHLDAIEYRNNIEKIMALDQVAEAKQREVCVDDRFAEAHRCASY
jgi:hypothetical protein